MSLTAETIDRLKSQLLTSGLSQRDQPLFQIINLLIDAARQSFTEINQVTGGGGGGGGGALGATYLTTNVETGILPNSRQLIAGVGIQFNDSPGGRRVISAVLPLVLDGENGKDGEPGPPGINGIPGSAGAQGLQGIPGPPGEDAEEPEYPYIIPGPQGPQGPAGGGGGSATIIETDVGSTPVWRGKFTITNALISSSSKIFIQQAPGPYTGKGTRADEAEMDPLFIYTEPGSGQAIAKWQTLPIIATQINRNDTARTVTNQFASMPHEIFAMRIGKVKGNIKFQYMVL